MKIKKSFLSLLTKKIEEVQKIINEPKKEKPRFGITTKRLSSVVATTRPMSNNNTTSRSLRQIFNEKYELCNSQENSTGNHNSILLTIYINYPWSVLQLHICCVSYPNIHILSSYLLVIYLMFYYSSTMHLPQGQHIIYMCPNVIPSTLLLISVIHAYTMCIP